MIVAVTSRDTTKIFVPYSSYLELSLRIIIKTLRFFPGNLGGIPLALKSKGTCPDSHMASETGREAIKPRPSVVLFMLLKDGVLIL